MSGGGQHKQAAVQGSGGKVASGGMVRVRG